MKAVVLFCALTLVIGYVSAAGCVYKGELNSFLSRMRRSFCIYLFARNKYTPGQLRKINEACFCTNKYVIHFVHARLSIVIRITEAFYSINIYTNIRLHLVIMHLIICYSVCSKRRKPMLWGRKNGRGLLQHCIFYANWFVNVCQCTLRLYIARIWSCWRCDVRTHINARLCE